MANYQALIDIATVQPRLRVIAQLAREAPDGPLPAALFARTHDPVLVATPLTSSALLLGIVFLMTNKPALPEALLVMAIALVLGLASSVLIARPLRAIEQGNATDAAHMSEAGA